MAPPLEDFRLVDLSQPPGKHDCPGRRLRLGFEGSRVS
jgi:hypothetical protein